MSSPRGRSPTADYELDAEIARLLRVGAAEAGLGLAWRRYAGRVRKWLQRFDCPAPVLEDATQEVFVRAYAERERLEGNNVGGWIFTLTRYEALTRARLDKRERHQHRLAHRHWLRAATTLTDEAAEYARLHRRLAEYRSGLDAEEGFFFDSLGDREPEEVVAARYAAAFGDALSHSALRNRRLRVRRQVYQVLTGKEFSHGGQ